MTALGWSTMIPRHFWCRADFPANVVLLDLLVGLTVFLLRQRSFQELSKTKTLPETPTKPPKTAFRTKAPAQPPPRGRTGKRP